MALNPTHDPTGPFQYIPVPNEHVPAVLAYLGALLAAPALAATTARPATTATADTEADNAGDGWTDSELARFFSLGTSTSELVERMLRYLAEHPGQKLSTRKLAEELSVKYSVMKILPTNVARTLGRHFPGQEAAPWSYQSGLDMDPPRSDEVFFWTTAVRAHQLSRLASGERRD